MKFYIILFVVVIFCLLLYFYRKKHTCKETWFSYNREVGKVERDLWNKYYERGVKEIKKTDANIRREFPYRGTGNYIGMICREPNKWCTSYLSYLN